MTRAQARVLMVGTALEGRGGVAAVVSVLQRDGLFEREAVRYLASHVDGSPWAKARVAAGAIAATLALCLRARPAVMHAHCASRASFLRKSLLLLIARACGSRTVYHLHGGGFREFAGVEAGPVLRWWIRHTLENSSVVIALSEAWAGHVLAFAPRARVVVVPNSVPLPAPAPEAEEEGRILFLGRVEAAKGAFELLEAVAVLAPTFPGLVLVLGGEGELAAVRHRAHELGIAAHLALPGWIGQEDKAAELARAAIFCLPSHAEGVPMAMLEAMAAGKAVVVSAVGGIPDTVADGVNGVLVPPRNVSALAGALATLLADRALRQRLGTAARATIAERFSTEVVVGKISALYGELAGAAR